MSISSLVFILSLLENKKKTLRGGGESSPLKSGYGGDSNKFIEVARSRPLT